MTPKNWSSFHAGPWSDLYKHEIPHPLVGKVRGKVFLKEPLSLNGMEVSFGALPPGVAVPFLHAHRLNEELYIFVRGQGEMLVDGETIPVSEGSAVRVAPAGERSWRNTGKDSLVYLVVQARAGTMERGTMEDGVELKNKPAWKSAP
jgi:mannose-6-phosphate isomerase-like protein (cupin superfamily)